MKTHKELAEVADRLRGQYKCSVTIDMQCSVNAYDFREGVSEDEEYRIYLIGKDAFHGITLESAEAATHEGMKSETLEGKAAGLEKEAARLRELAKATE